MFRRTAFCDLMIQFFYIWSLISGQTFKTFYPKQSLFSPKICNYARTNKLFSKYSTFFPESASIEMINKSSITINHQQKRHSGKFFIVLNQPVRYFSNLEREINSFFAFSRLKVAASLHRPTVLTLDLAIPRIFLYSASTIIGVASFLFQSTPPVERPSLLYFGWNHPTFHAQFYVLIIHAWDMPFFKKFFINPAALSISAGFSHIISGSALNHVNWRFAYLLVSRLMSLTLSSHETAPLINSTRWR